MRFQSLSLLLLCALVLSCREGEAPVVEEGVSLALAQYRARTLSDLHYDLFFQIPDSLQQAVGGRESIRFRLERPVPLQLDFREGREALLSLQVNGEDREIDYRQEHLVLDRRWLRAGENTVELSFRCGDRSLNRNEEYLYTLFVPDRARTVFPCFDQPDLKGRFTLRLEVPAQWEAVANGPLLASETSAGRKNLFFKETPPLSTYLFAFCAGRWQKESQLRNGRPMTVYFRETDPAKTAQLPAIFAQVSRALDALEEYTAIPCPFEKYDLVIVPGFQFGGMEHPGCILFNDKRMFLGPDPTTSEKLSRIELIAHETSHLWFGDAVTMRWFNDVWTKEVYANFFGARISTPLYPEVNVPLRDFRSFQVNAYAEDRTAGTNPIRRDLPNLSSAGLIYGNIVYDKAPVVMHMLSDILGEEAFREGIREYLARFLWGNADWNDLIAVLDAHTPRDLRAWSRVWVEEKGMPTISYTLEGRTLTVRQEDPLGRGLVWPQQVHFETATGESAVTLWSDAPEVSLQLADVPSQPLLPNLDARSYGFFRLEGERLSAAVEALPVLGRVEGRLSLLATLYENFLQGTLEPERFATVLERVLRQERDPLVAGAAASYLKTMAIHGPLAGSELLEKLLCAAASDQTLSAEIRLTAFRALMEVCRSQPLQEELYRVFREGSPFRGVPLNLRDYIGLAYELAIRFPERYEEIARLQESRIQNPDLLREFRYVYRAVSPEKERRDALFADLLRPENRQVEPWAAAALAYLNHPLRQASAIGYIVPGLQVLPEIQRTGDIFFPKNWCVSLLRGHSSPAAAAELQRFLADDPLPPLLRDKLLQSADHLLR